MKTIVTKFMTENLKLCKFWIDASLKRKLCISFVNVLAPLIIGLLIYLLFIPTAHVSEYIYRLAGQSFAVSNVDLNGTFITCYLADFLWGYALFNIVFLIEMIYPKDIVKVFVICVACKFRLI